jgi:hypothetical protein
MLRMDGWNGRINRTPVDDSVRTERSSQGPFSGFPWAKRRPLNDSRTRLASAYVNEFPLGPLGHGNRSSSTAAFPLLEIYSGDNCAPVFVFSAHPAPVRAELFLSSSSRTSVSAGFNAIPECQHL